MIRAVLLNDTSVQNHYGCRLVVNNIYLAASRAGIEIIHTVPIGSSWEEESHRKVIEACDLVLVNGEGTLHSAKLNAIILASVAPFCKERGIRCYLFNTVYQNNNNDIDRLVEHFDGIFVRESYSSAALGAAGVASTVVPDLVFYSHREIFRSTAGDGRRGFMYTASAIRENARILYTASLGAGYNRFVTLSQAMGQKSEPSKEGWKNWMRRVLIRVLGFRGYAFLNKVARIGWVSFSAEKYATPSFDDLIKVLYETRFVFTGFFHMSCFCIMTRTPFCALPSNTHKIDGMLADIGIGQRVVTKGAYLAGEGGPLEDFSPHEMQLIERYCCSAESSIDMMFATFAGRS